MNKGMGARISLKQRLASFAGKQRIVGLTEFNPSRVVLVLVAYGVLAAIFTYPVVLNILTKAAGSTDVYEYMWELWWAKRSLVDLQSNPSNLAALYHPYGADHPILWLDAYLMSTALPLVMLLDPLAANNMHLLSSYVLTGFTTYLLCYSLTKRHWPSFVGGVIFAFSPVRSTSAARGGLSMALTYWLPLYVLFLLSVFNRPNVRNAFLCGIYLAFSILSSFLHVAHFVIPLTVVFLIYQHFANPTLLYSSRFLRSFALALGLAAIVVSPFYVPLLKANIAGELDYFRRFGILRDSAVLLSFLVPPPGQLLVERIEPLRTMAQELLPTRYWVEYLGFAPLALAMCGAVKKKTRMWMILALVSAVLALGPLLHVTGDLVEYSVAGETGFVLLPGALLTRLPFYEWARQPARFGELTVFSVAVLASYGASTLSRIIRRRLLWLGVVSLLLICILLDYALFFPFPTQDIPVPRFYSALSTDGGDCGVLDVGTGTLNHRGMYFQIVHQHPIARGYIYRFPPGVQYYQEFLEQLVKPEPDIINADCLVPILQQLDIGYVVLHKLSDTPIADLLPFLDASLGEPVYEDEQIAAFAVRPSEPVDAPEIPLLLLDKQWHPIEFIDGVPSRWMMNDGTMYVKVETEGSYQLALVVHPFKEPRHLQIFVNEEQIEEYHVGGMQSYVTSAFMLKSREWTPISFHVPEGCEVPSEVIEGQNDARCLSMLFQQVGVRVVQSEM